MRTIQIDATLAEEQIERLAAAVPEELSVVAKLSGIATGLLRDLADGAIMLDSQTSRHVLGLIGSIEELVPSLERANHMHQGRIVAEWLLDPIWLPALEEMATMQGVTVQDLVQNAMDYAMDQGWLYQIPVEPMKLRFAPEDLKVLAEIIGVENPTGTDIARWITKQAEEPEFAVR